MTIFNDMTIFADMKIFNNMTIFDDMKKIGDMTIFDDWVDWDGLGMDITGWVQRYRVSNMVVNCQNLTDAFK